MTQVSDGRPVVGGQELREQLLGMERAGVQSEPAARPVLGREAPEPSGLRPLMIRAASPHAFFRASRGSTRRAYAAAPPASRTLRAPTGPPTAVLDSGAPATAPARLQGQAPPAPRHAAGATPFSCKDFSRDAPLRAPPLPQVPRAPPRLRSHLVRCCGSLRALPRGRGGVRPARGRSARTRVSAEDEPARGLPVSAPPRRLPRRARRAFKLADLLGLPPVQWQGREGRVPAAVSSARSSTSVVSRTMKVRTAVEAGEGVRSWAWST